MAEMLANAASTTLTAAVTPSGTTLTVASSSTFPTTGDYAIVVDGNTTNAEIMEVTAVSGNTWTVTRASEPYGGSQTAVSHASGGTVTQVLTVQGLTNFSGALNQANTWMAAQTFKPSGTTSQWVVIQPDPSYSFVGIYNGGTYYGIAPGLPSKSGYATIGGYYSGLGIGGNASSSQSNVPIFGVLASNQSANGLGNVALTVYSNNVIESFNNTLDDGSGNMTVAGTLTASTTLYVQNGATGVTPGTTAGTYLGVGDMPSLLMKGKGFYPAIGDSFVLWGTDLILDGVQGSTVQPNYGGWSALHATGTNALQLAPGGSTSTQHNTLDDGSGNMTTTGLVTASGGISIPSGQSFNNSGTYLGSPVVLALSGGTGISVTNPMSPGTAVVTNTGVTSLTAGTGIGISSATGSVTITNTAPPPANATPTAAGLVEVPQTPSGTPRSPVVFINPSELELTTTSATTIFAEAPANTGMFVVYLYARVVTATTSVTATLTYTSMSGAQTYTIWNAQNLPVGDNSAVPFFFQNVGGDTITLSCTAGTASQVYIDARLVAM